MSDGACQCAVLRVWNIQTASECLVGNSWGVHTHTAECVTVMFAFNRPTAFVLVCWLIYFCYLFASRWYFYLHNFSSPQFKSFSCYIQIEDTGSHVLNLYSVFLGTSDYTLWMPFFNCLSCNMISGMIWRYFRSLGHVKKHPQTQTVDHHWYLLLFTCPRGLPMRTTWLYTNTSTRWRWNLDQRGQILLLLQVCLCVTFYSSSFF